MHCCWYCVSNWIEYPPSLPNVWARYKALIKYNMRFRSKITQNKQAQLVIYITKGSIRVAYGIYIRHVVDKYAVLIASPVQAINTGRLFQYQIKLYLFWMQTKQILPLEPARENKILNTTRNESKRNCWNTDGVKYPKSESPATQTAQWSIQETLDYSKYCCNI